VSLASLFSWLAVACTPGAGNPATTLDGTTVSTTAGETGSSSSGTTASTSTSTTNDSDSSSAFVPETDLGSGNDCDVFLQDCPDGQKCVPCSLSGQGWDAWRCAPIDPVGKGIGAACTVTGCADDCDARSVCTFAYPTNDGDGVCMGLCNGDVQDPGCDDPEAVCLLAGNFVDSICSLPCDPLSPVCPDGLGCRFFRYVFTCNDGDGLPYGADCQEVSDGVCGSGLVCTQGSAPGCAPGSCCTVACDQNDSMADQGCPDYMAGQTCKPFQPNGEPVPGAENIGVCSL
jgi:hypothetical protein